MLDNTTHHDLDKDKLHQERQGHTALTDLVLCKLGTAGPLLSMPIKNPKEELIWVTTVAPVYTNSILSP